MPNKIKTRTVIKDIKILDKTAGGALVPFTDKFPRHTKLYRLMSTVANETFVDLG